MTKPKTGLWVKIVLLAVVVLLGAAVVVPYFVKARATECNNACINNLRQIDGAKEQWALEKEKRPADAVNEAEVEQYIKGGKPNCPGGGAYTYGLVGQNPACSMIEHKL
jgi:hypothetical protein